MADGWDSFRSKLPAALTTRPANVAANVASILGLLVAIIDQFKWNSSAIPLTYLCGLSFFLLVRYMRQERWARYSEGQLIMERAQRRLKEATDRLLYGEGGNALFFQNLQDSVTAFSEAYTLVTGTRCRASLKEVYAESVIPAPMKRGEVADPVDVLLAATILRGDPDATPPISQEAAVLVSENSDFQDVFERAIPFFSNDLPKMWAEGKYRNSHWSDDLRSSKRFPYRSSIVWPIEVAPAPGVQPAQTKERVIAFLCVDSERRGAFIQRADVAFGSVYAHALYPGLRYARGDR